MNKYEIDGMVNHPQLLEIYKKLEEDKVSLHERIETIDDQNYDNGTNSLILFHQDENDWLQQSSCKKSNYSKYQVPPQLKFYEESKYIDSEKKEIQRMREREIKNLANSNKITDNSLKILIESLENKLTGIISSIEIEDPKAMGFQHLGRILTQLEIIRFIQYDEKCECKNSIKQVITSEDEFYNSLGSKRMLKQEEMDFHERFFNFLSLDDVFDSENAYQILRILLHPRRLKRKDAIVCLNSYRIDYMQKDSIEECQHLIDQYRKLIDNRLNFIQTGYFKPKHFQSIKELKEKETVKPALNKESRKLASQNLQKFIQEYDQFVSKYDNSEKSQIDNSQIQSKSQFKDMNQIEILYKRKELKDLKNYSAKLQKEDDVYKLIKSRK